MRMPQLVLASRHRTRYCDKNVTSLGKAIRRVEAAGRTAGINPDGKVSTGTEGRQESQ